MSNPPKAGIYLHIEFEWPQPFNPEDARYARKLHDVVQRQSWIREAVAGSHGLGAGPDSLWVFWLEDYAALERLLRTPDDPVCKDYTEFFTLMPVVQGKIREEVLFL